MTKGKFLGYLKALIGNKRKELDLHSRRAGGRGWGVGMGQTGGEGWGLSGGWRALTGNQVPVLKPNSDASCEVRIASLP